MEINQLSYGNPTHEQLLSIQDVGLVDNIYLSQQDIAPPLNDSEQVQEELNEIVNCLNSIADESNIEYLKRYKSYDRNLTQALISILADKSVDIEEICPQITDDIKSVITKIKYHHQRPRPYQLAQALKLMLFPRNSVTSNSPSYPCEHTVMAKVILTVVGNKHPAIFPFCRELIEDIATSRIYLGLQYRSDTTYAKQLADAILTNSDFAKKYNI